MECILGIETSCDETAVSLCSVKGKLQQHLIYSQINSHAHFGGVVPETAARLHLKILPKLIKKILIDDSNIQLVAIAATTGPGLIGGLLIGSSFGLGMALARHIPFYRVHHLDAHIFLIHSFENITYPYYALLLSGGHTMLVCTKGFDHYTILGQTLDDSMGESFDKVAKMLELPYPGGPYIEQLAKKGDPHAYSFPKPMEHKRTLNFSLSGLKSSIHNLIQNTSSMNILFKQNVAASFQWTLWQILSKRLELLYHTNPSYPLVASGGVLANEYLRSSLQSWSNENRIPLYLLPKEFCTDNGFMVAYKGMHYYLNHKKRSIWKNISVSPRWSLENV